MDVHMNDCLLTKHKHLFVQFCSVIFEYRFMAFVKSNLIITIILLRLITQINI